MSLKLPVIPSCRSLTDVISMANNLRNWFKGLSDNGGVVSVADLTSGRVVPKYSGGTTSNNPSVTPPVVTGFTVTGAFRTIMCSWDQAAMNQNYLAYYEIWRSTANDIGTAECVGATVARIYVDEPPDASLSVTYYYWVRAVSTSGLAGPYNATEGTPGETANDPAYLMQVLSSELAKVTPSPSVPDLVYAVDRFALKMGTGDNAVYPFVVAQIPGSDPARYAVFMDTAFIKDATITSAKIQSLTTDKLAAGSALIGSALIDDAAITSAKIAGSIQSTNYIPGVSGWLIDKSGTISGVGLVVSNASIDTLQLAGNAVTIPTASVDDSQYPVPANTETEVLARTVDFGTIAPQGALVNAQFTIYVTTGGDNSWEARLYKDNVLVKTVAQFVINNVTDVTVPLVHLDSTPGTGSHTYSLRVFHNSNASGGAKYRTMVVTGFKK